MNIQHYRRKELSRRPSILPKSLLSDLDHHFDASDLIAGLIRPSAYYTAREIYILTGKKYHPGLCKYLALEYYDYRLNSEVITNPEVDQLLGDINYNLDFATVYDFCYYYYQQLTYQNYPDLLRSIIHYHNQPYRPSIVAIMVIHDYCQRNQINPPMYYANSDELPIKIATVNHICWNSNTVINYPNVCKMHLDRRSGKFLTSGSYGSISVIYIDGTAYANKYCDIDKFPSFLRETTALINFYDNSRFVRIHSVNKSIKGYNIIIDLCNISLYELIRTAPLMVYDNRRRYLREILLAVKDMMDNGYMHRDIKSENILVSFSTNTIGTIKIADFGLSKIITDNYRNSPRIYTPNYRPPELWSEKDYDYKAELWAIGCIMAEMITSSILFPGVSDYKITRRIKNRFRHRDPFSDITRDKLESDLLTGLLRPNPSDRISIDQALNHDYFKIE